jgi:predicted permease
VTIDESEELGKQHERLEVCMPATGEVAVVPLLHQALGRNLRTALLVLWGVVAGVLMIACANVANLMLARAASRQKEIALRLALGAGGWRVARQLLIESVVLAVIGGGVGVLLGWWGLQLFIAVSPGNIPRLNEVTLDGTALGFTLSISVLTGVLFGLAPAWQFSRLDLNEALKEGTRGASAGTAAGRTRSVLVVAEVALSLVLLVGAGLMLQSFVRMMRAERGFQPEHLLTAELDFSVSGFTTWVRPTATRPQVPLRELIERLRALPGVQAVGAGSRLLRRENRPPQEPVAIFGRPTLKPEEQPKADFNGITPEWLRALGGRVLRGRDFTEADTMEAPGVVLINETLAQRYFPNEDPIGQRFKMGSNQPPLNATNVWGQTEWSTIVGVVSDVKSLHPHPEVVPEVYMPYWQWPMQSPTILVRTTGDPAMLAENHPHRRPRKMDRLFWVWLSRMWRSWQESLIYSEDWIFTIGPAAQPAGSGPKTAVWGFGECQLETITLSEPSSSCDLPITVFQLMYRVGTNRSHQSRIQNHTPRGGIVKLINFKAPTSSEVGMSLGLGYGKNRQVSDPGEVRPGRNGCGL